MMSKLPRVRIRQIISLHTRCPSQVTREDILTSYPWLCKSLGLSLQFSHLSSCFWFAAMAINVFNTFKRIRVKDWGLFLFFF